jgi:hypothetical protein
MADQYSGDMMVALGDAVAKTVKPHGFPQPGVFSTDLFQHFTIDMWLPFVLIAEASKITINGSKATAIHRK